MGQISYCLLYLFNNKKFDYLTSVARLESSNEESRCIAKSIIPGTPNIYIYIVVRYYMCIYVRVTACIHILVNV